ncbi:hypothetical protein PRNP1_006040 [Phytophthora ramorum]
MPAAEGGDADNPGLEAARAGQGRECLCRGVTALRALVVAVVCLVALDVVMVTNIFSGVIPEVEDGDICTTKMVNVSTIKYHSEHKYYDELKAAMVPGPIFREEHAKLCHKRTRITAKYNYCLPISGHKDAEACKAADRMDLLKLDAYKSICYASVLHMLLVEVYEELQASGNIPFLTFGSLLGAVRGGAMIPFTEDADIGFVGDLVKFDPLRLALRRKGYHIFYMGIWRVCVAPTHPLAGHLYDPSLPMSEDFDVPYVDLYKMKQIGNGNWDLQELNASNGSILLSEKVQPFSQVMINGMSFDTVQDPDFFLKEAYGDDYMTPKPRGTVHIE